MKAKILYNTTKDWAAKTAREASAFLKSMKVQEVEKGADLTITVGAAGRERLGLPLPPSQVAAVTADIDLARARLGAAAFEARWAEGAALTLEEAAARASRRRVKTSRPVSGWESLTPSTSAPCRPPTAPSCTAPAPSDLSTR